MMGAAQSAAVTGNGTPLQAKAIILMYHRITRTEFDPWGMCVSPENFSEQLAAINAVATPISLIDYARSLVAGTLPERTVVVTFDDGYVDNFEQALPLLRRHNVPATLFVTTCHIDSDREFWWDRLETVLLAVGTLPARLELPLPGGEVREWLTGVAATYTAEAKKADKSVRAWNAKPGTRLGFFYDVWKTLSPMPDVAREQSLDHVERWANAGKFQGESRRSMTAEEIRVMGREGIMEIGSHTVNHPPLPAHESSVQVAQIRDSRDRLQEILGVPVKTFAYPHGEYSDETIRILRELGFECAVTVEQRLAGERSDVMKLPRFGVKDVGGDAFRAQLQGWFGLSNAAS
jgi:peptidoglycan/xylan/chitin deacetylase (PgdA/CDA1 family)